MPDGTGIPSGFNRTDLELAGYVGWRTWADLHASAFADIPGLPGCYVVLRSSAAPPTFLPVSPGGHFKGEDPTVSLERMAAEWTPDAHVVYIGKADVLRTRLKAYARFGAGEPVAHKGGRLIWQLADADTLLVAWRALTGSGTARESWNSDCWPASHSSITEDVLWRT